MIPKSAQLNKYSFPVSPIYHPRLKKSRPASLRRIQEPKRCCFDKLFSDHPVVLRDEIENKSAIYKTLMMPCYHRVGSGLFGDYGEKAGKGLSDEGRLDADDVLEYAGPVNGKAMN